MADLPIILLFNHGLWSEVSQMSCHLAVEQRRQRVFKVVVRLGVIGERVRRLRSDHRIMPPPSPEVITEAVSRTM